MRVKEWLRELREQDHRETDERARQIRLLVVRDGFIAAMLLILALGATTTLLSQGTMRPVEPGFLAIFSVVAVVVVGAVMAVSAMVRGGFGKSIRTAVFRGLLLLGGVWAGLGILVILSKLGVLSPPPGGSWWPDVLGVLAGSVAVLVVTLVRSRGRNR